MLAAALLWPYMVAYVGDLGAPVAYTYLASTVPARIPSLITNAIPPCGHSDGRPLAARASDSVAGTSKVQWPSDKVAFAFLVAYLPVSLLTRYLMAIHQGTGDFARFNAVRLAVQIATLAGVGALFTVHIASVEAVLVVTIIGNLAALLVAGKTLLRRRTPRVATRPAPRSSDVSVRAAGPSRQSDAG